jgi:hypothetical protein
MQPCHIWRFPIVSEAVQRKGNAMTILLLKAAVLSGLGLWLAIALLNNIVAFKNGVFAIGMLMGMKLFELEPAIRTPLLGRRVTSTGWHRLIYSTVLVAETVTVALLGIAAAALLGSALDIVLPATAVGYANIALLAFVALGALMLVGGAWFVYYIRQEGAQITHLVMIGVGIAAVQMVNGV